ncbi:MAG TPA: L,D-transpeptidase family protein [Vicinamibacteria bacterium]|nr:L,D-transpeptidase family protein [Vicinamibacteria bacterium]
MLVVVTDGWDATQGTARAFERSAAGGWEPALGAVPVSLGRSGLAWGLGLHGEGRPAGTDGGAVKREGDGRSPAGVFYLASATGYAATPPPGVRLHYTMATPSLKCVDDPRSRQYNRIVDTSRSLRDFDSFEDMRRDDDLYRLVVVVAHNALQRPGGGSCIFLHQRLGPGSVTAGCSAFDAAALDRIVGWLDPGAQPVLVQLPRVTYEEVRRAWGLPAPP